MGVKNLRFGRIYWGLVTSKYQTICKNLLTTGAIPSKAVFCASSTRNLCFIKPSFEMSSSNLLQNVPIALTMTGVICTLFRFQSVLISPDRFVYVRIFGRHLLQTLQSFGEANSIKLAVLLILSNTIMSVLLLIASWSAWIEKFHRILVELFSATCVDQCWYHGMYFSINPCSSSKRT